MWYPAVAECNLLKAGFSPSTAVSGNNLIKEINERWDCQREMIPNHFVLLWIKPAFLKQNCQGSMGKFRKNHSKSKGLLLN